MQTAQAYRWVRVYCDGRMFHRGWTPRPVEEITAWTRDLCPHARTIVVVEESEY